MKHFNRLSSKQRRSKRRMSKSRRMKHGGQMTTDLITYSQNSLQNSSTASWLSSFISKIMSSSESAVSFAKSTYTSAVEKLLSISIPGYNQVSQFARDYVLNPTMENWNKYTSGMSQSSLAVGGVVAAAISAIAYYRYNKYSQNKELAKKTINEAYGSFSKNVVDNDLQKLPSIVPQELVELSQVDAKPKKSRKVSKHGKKTRKSSRLARKSKKRSSKRKSKKRSSKRRSRKH